MASKNFKFFGLATILAGSTMITTNTFATTITGPYVDAGAGAVITQTEHNTSKFGKSNDIHNKAGFNGFAGAGYGFGNGLRSEVEGYYGRSYGTDSSRGSSESYGGFANVLYDIDLKKHFNIDTFATPYVGVGAGYLATSYNIHNPVRNVHGTQGSFAYQGIVGSSFDTPVKNLQAFVDYRMIGQTMSKDSFSPDDSRMDHRFNHTFNVGLRYRFGDDPKVIPATIYTAVPIPEPARTYLVFFDWDKTTLNETTKNIIRNAAYNSTHIQTTKIIVNGYTDNSSARGGIAGKNYNLKLSIKRADTVKAELVKDGVSENNIETFGFGETHPLVKTKPNTREAQNRRVEIILK